MRITTPHNKEKTGIRNIEKNCWEVNKCGRAKDSKCPAYPDHGKRCWKVTGTSYGGGKYSKKTVSEKILHCRGKCKYFKTYLDPSL